MGAGLEKIADAVQKVDAYAGVCTKSAARAMLPDPVPLPGTSLGVQVCVGHLLLLAKVGNPLVTYLTGAKPTDTRTQDEVLMDDLRCMYLCTRSVAEGRAVIDAGQLDHAVLAWAEELPAAVYLHFTPVLTEALTRGMESAIPMEAPGDGIGGDAKKASRPGGWWFWRTRWFGSGD